MVAVTFFPVAEAAPLGEEPEVEAFPRSVRSGQNSHSISYDTSLPLTTVFMSLPLPAIVLEARSESDCDREALKNAAPKNPQERDERGGECGAAMRAASRTGHLLLPPLARLSLVPLF